MAASSYRSPHQNLIHIWSKNEITHSLACIACNSFVTFSLTISHAKPVPGAHSPILELVASPSFIYNVNAIFISCLENAITSSIVSGLRWVVVRPVVALDVAADDDPKT